MAARCLHQQLQAFFQVCYRDRQDSKSQILHILAQILLCLKFAVPSSCNISVLIERGSLLCTLPRLYRKPMCNVLKNSVIKQWLLVLAIKYVV